MKRKEEGEKVGERSVGWEEREKDGERKEYSYIKLCTCPCMLFISNKMRDCDVKAKLTKPNKANSK